MNNQLQIINGNRIRLRPITLKDTDLIVKWRNNPRVRENFIFQAPFTSDMHNEWMETKVASGEVIQYIIEVANEGKPVGSVYLRDIDRKNDSAEFGIFIGEDSVRGKGIGTETTSLFVRYALESLDFHRIFLRVIEGNKAAYHSYLKAGFRQEGVFHDMIKLNEKYVNVIFMAIIKESE